MRALTAPPVITGWGVVSPLGIGAAAFTEAVLSGAGCAGCAVDISAMFDEPLPRDVACVLPGFDVREHLGRKGTSAYDRVTALTVVACGLALRDAGLHAPGPATEETGLALGTNLGSARSTWEFGRETYLRSRPHLVSPQLFPNAAINCAAGQAAIRYGLRGVNATLAAGPPAALTALRYARNALRGGHATAMIAGAAEEYSPQNAWLARHWHGGREARLLGEAAALFALEPAAEGATGRGRAELLAVELAGGEPAPEAVSATVEGCARRALALARVAPEEVDLAVTCGGPAECPRTRAEEEVLDRLLAQARCRRFRVADTAGDCLAASAGVQLATVLARFGSPERSPDRSVALVTSLGWDGAAGAAVLRRCPDDRSDHRL
ncbi:beta-ketoacyl synthase N-terminal-like domain-containing protein [Streptomyces sp. NPDC018045]|uniref:beta-ketoacyl synthase N-terminal-like domain-containing protein n=1 Tax=Streptomyces sp. NPDC018045 TaxID=3365037 RepID=UPI0037901B14